MPEEEQYTPDDEDIFIAYRFSSLGLMMDPNSKPYDPEATKEADDEYRRWLEDHDSRIRAEALREAAQLRHGTDLNPTTDGNRDVMWWYGYLQGLDRTWRDRLSRLADKAENE